MTDCYIWVVDDEPTMRHLAETMLRHLDHRVRGFESAVEALALCQAGEELPDLIFMDIRMPGLDGIEAVRRLHGDARTRDLPVVSLSGEPIEGPELLAAGFAHYIRKPFRRKQLAEAVANFAARPESRREGRPPAKG